MQYAAHLPEGWRGTGSWFASDKHYRERSGGLF
jgi:hypothetical protein